MVWEVAGGGGSTITKQQVTVLQRGPFNGDPKALTYGQVANILGGPGQETWRSEDGNMQNFLWSNRNGSNLTVVFVGGRIAGVEANGLK
jgi:hypothetical protein